MGIALAIINIVCLLALSGYVGYTIGKGNIIIKRKLTEEEQKKLDKLEEERQKTINKLNEQIQELTFGGDI